MCQISTQIFGKSKAATADATAIEADVNSFYVSQVMIWTVKSIFKLLSCPSHPLAIQSPVEFTTDSLSSVTRVSPYSCASLPPPAMMATPSDGHSGTSSGARLTAKVDLGEYFDMLDPNEETFDDLEIDVDDPAINESIKWLASARVHTKKTFS